MISADVAARALALGVHAPFDRLAETELLLVSRYAHQRAYSAGDILLAGGHVAERLIVVTGGTVLFLDAYAPPVFDAPSTLFGLKVAGDYRAGPGGVQTLSIARPHLFTIARECPDFVVGLSAAGRPES